MQIITQTITTGLWTTMAQRVGKHVKIQVMLHEIIRHRLISNSLLFHKGLRYLLPSKTAAEDYRFCEVKLTTEKKIDC